jgi:hypothetical protein
MVDVDDKKNLWKLRGGALITVVLVVWILLESAFSRRDWSEERREYQWKKYPEEINEDVHRTWPVFCDATPYVIPVLGAGCIILIGSVAYKDYVHEEGEEEESKAEKSKRHTLHHGYEPPIPPPPPDPI